MSRVEGFFGLSYLDGKWVGRITCDGVGWVQPRPHGTRDEARAWVVRAVDEALRDDDEQGSAA